MDEEEGQAIGTVVYIAVSGLYAGQIPVSDAIKKDAKTVIAGLKKMNVAAAMLTGDRKESTEAAVFADTGVAMLCVLNSIRILYR